MSLTCITPTGGRPEALALCDRYMQDQINQDFRWIVLDDCDPASPKPERADLVMRPGWRWDGSEHTLSRSLVSLLDAAPGAVVVIEDDDVYRPGYTEFMALALEKHDLVGLKNPVYYNVVNRTWQEMPSEHRASLCATGVKGEAKRVLRWIAEKRRWPIDEHLWRMCKGHLIDLNLVVGIKGLPGRPGIGMGHRMEGKPDPEANLLRGLIGDCASCYDRFYQIESGS